VHLLKPNGQTAFPQHLSPSKEAETDVRLQQAKELARKVQEAAVHRQEAAAYRQAGRHKLQTEIAQLQWHIDELRQAQRLIEEQQARILALQDLNVRELVLHRQRIIAWKLINQSQKRAVPLRETAKAQKQTVVIPPTAKMPEKPAPPAAAIKVRKKANFNRYYAQQSLEPAAE
jgi:hypothetical protein